MKTTGTLIDTCREDAVERLRPFAAYPDTIEHNARAFSWPQAWTNTACGFGGIAGQEPTTAQTVVVMEKWCKAAAVYHNGRFAYLVERPSEAFYTDMSLFSLKGESDARRASYELADQPEDDGGTDGR